jgi:Tol biopolymer transport system component
MVMFIIPAGSHAKESVKRNRDAIYYLSGNIIRMVGFPDKKKASVVFEVPKRTANRQYEIHGLSCGPDNTLAFHLVVTDFSKLVSRTTIQTINPISKEVRTLIDEGDTEVMFPSLSYDGSLLYMGATDSKHDHRYLIIKNLTNGSVKRYDQLEGVSSLSPDNKVLAISGVDQKTKKARIYLYDLDKSELSPWMEGTMPVFSPNGELIAYTTDDHERLVISDMTGKTIQSYDRYFVSRINGWIDNDRILFTIGVFMYKNHIGILDLKKKRIEDIAVPTSGEIEGICYTPRQAAKTGNN